MTGPTSDTSQTAPGLPFVELADLLSSLVAVDSIPALSQVLDQRVPQILSCDRSQIALIDKRAKA